MATGYNLRALAKDLAVTLGARIWYIEEATRFLLESRLLSRFLDPHIGAEYGFGYAKKSELLRRLRSISRHVRSATTVSEWLVLGTQILQIPRTVQGSVVECGCYKGASTCALSLICATVGRRLTACDSFGGLPEDGPGAIHRYIHLDSQTTYTPGLFAGSLDEVKRNLSEWGDVSVCDFISGFYSEALNRLRGPVAFAFLDVDLASSMRDCLRHIWPLLIDGGFIYTDDSCDMDVVSLWFDRNFWEEVGCDAPGYIGSGAGLCGLSPDYSSLGYSRKLLAPTEVLKDVRFW
jgi:macrocin-O-methyltransferase TylF-like protien